MGVLAIGGDVAGLHGLGDRLRGVAPDLRNSAEALSRSVSGLVGDAGWHGDAAAAFTGAWEQDAAALVQLGECVTLVAGTVERLAVALQAAQRRLDAAQAVAESAGLPVTAGGLPEGPYPPEKAAAVTAFQTEVAGARSAAQDARDAATMELHSVLSAVDPAVPANEDGLLATQDLAALGTVLRGYYGLPNEYSKRAADAVSDFEARYRQARFERKHTPKGAAKAALTAQLKDLRAEGAELKTDLSAAEGIASHFHGGKLLGTDVGDLFGHSELDGTSRLSRLADGVPVLDVVLGAGATWAQAKDDHDKGWSWGHAIAADGASNAAAIAAGLATDAIPIAGPFLAPITAYGVGGLVFEATHEGHWTEHIHDDGVLVGTAEGMGDTAKAFYDNDVIEMKNKIVDGVEHPADTAKSLWRGVTSLF